MLITSRKIYYIKPYSVILHYIKLYYIKLHIILNYIMLHYVELRKALNYIILNDIITLQYVTLHHIIKSQHIVLCYISILLYVIPQTGLPVWGSYSFKRVASLGRMILPLSPGLHPTLGALGRMSLHLSPLVSHSACLVSPLSPTLGALGRMPFQG